jgi:hypothetical protein
MTDHMSKALRTSTYLLRFTPEEKAMLEQKTRIVAARQGVPVTLADVLREGARLHLEDLLEKLPKFDDQRDGADGSQGAA